MHRLFRLTLMLVLVGIIALGETFADQIYVSGRLAPGQVRVFRKDNTYIVNRDYVIGGTLIIEPGTTVKFYPNGRLIDSTGGRIIADGFAKATYNANPDGIDPIATPGYYPNAQGFSGYADLKYFLYKGTQSTVSVTTVRDLTVHPQKYDHIFNVTIDTAARRIVDLRNEEIGTLLPPERVKIPFEQALMFDAARLEIDPNDDINLNIKPWTRLGAKAVNVTDGKIYFKGQPENNFSREWGHILVLPGARAAFFRNVVFEGFRKDTTVDRTAIYSNNGDPNVNWPAINNKMRLLTNGAGGVISTFSSRTWILNCEFRNNMSRYRGGAIQFLQTPDGFATMDEESYGALSYWAADKNPNITEMDGSISQINTQYARPAIDLIDEPAREPITLNEKQAYDDGRLSIFLGRFRNNIFDQNKVQLANVGTRMIGTPPVQVTVDLTDEAARFPVEYGNHAYGGAIYVAGKDGQPGEDTQIELGLGINNSINTSYGKITFPSADAFQATGNMASNYQNAGSTKGARGGALYLGAYTSMIVAGKFNYNETYTKYLQDSLTGTNNGFYSRGGAIFAENTMGHLTVRGGPNRDMIPNVTEFVQNKSGSGGAIFADGNTDRHMSPVIGGSDLYPWTRDYGYNIKFVQNSAICYGGAITTMRNMRINGSGGIDANSLIGYGGYHPVNFLQNTAGYAGGALNITIPSNQIVDMSNAQRSVSIIRAEFRENVVGSDIAQRNKPFIRGGGAVYSLNADLNVIKGAEFIKNKVFNGNGGAIALIHPETSIKRFFLTDIDNVNYDESGVATGFQSTDEVFTFRSNAYPADARMLTRFSDNEIVTDPEVLAAQNGTGTTQIGFGTKGTPSNLFGVHFVDQYNGFAVGMNGTIVKMTLGGSKWVYKNYVTPYRLIDVKFTSTSTGYIVGDRGVILKTTNGGNDWYEVRPAIDDFRLNSVFFTGTLIGYAVGEKGKIFKTTDAGETWFDPTMANYTNNTLNCVFFTGTNRGFAVGDRGTIITTANGGVTWDVKNANTLSNFKATYFYTSDSGFVAGSAGVIYKSNDGGNSWVRSFEDPTKNFTGFTMTDTRTGYAIGEYGLVLKTTDQGRNWNGIDPETAYTLYDITFPTSSTGFVVGEYGLIKKTTNAGLTWEEIIPADISYVDVKRYHQEINLPENGIGLGGAIYILDSVTVNRADRQDTISFNRVRMQNNKSFTGSAIYSDNYDMKLIFSRSLITGNEALSDVGYNQNYITGAAKKDAADPDKKIIANFASSDLAGACIYGEIQGPLPSGNSSWAANSIYNNKSRFEIRLPDAPNTKGILAGTTGIGFGGTDTLRGNYWGHTEANVDLTLGNRKIKSINGTDTTWWEQATTSTFFVESHFNDRTKTYMQFLFSNNPQSLADPRNQGPFESRERFTYAPVTNANGADENTPCATCFPEVVTFAGLVYDSYDKGTDIKTADYSDRRMSPIEDFAVGVPPTIRRFTAANNVNNPSYGKYVKRWLRDPFVAEAKDQNGNLKYPEIAKLQDEFRPSKDGSYYHPIGYPMYLESQVDYNGLAELSNHDPRLLNETVMFVVNETTGDFIRVNMRQVSEDASNRELFRARVELVPDSSNRYPNATIRRSTEGLFNLGTGDYLLRQIQWNPIREDRATLLGRRYHAGTNALAKVSDLFSNRPGMPVSNTGSQTYFAGERYNALPADTGDVIRIVSRTVLWKEGVNPSFNDGISFKVVRSTEPPVFTGNIVSLQKDTIVKIVPSEYPWKRSAGIMDTLRITQFLNKVFVTEDRDYPQPEGTYNNPDVLTEDGRGRDSIISVTAMDTNKYFDPRSMYFPDQYSQLFYEYSVSSASGLSRWLMTDLIPAGDNTVQNPRDNAQGYLVFRGRPMNPYVVPGGEDVYVRVSNFPPHYRNVDYLKSLNMTQDQIDKWVTIFPQYLHANAYDSANARYLQQDTINIGAKYFVDYTFKLFVVDSVPRFLPHDMASEVIKRRVNRQGDMVDYIEYKPSVYTCDLTPDNKLKANIAGIDAQTTKLRFMADFNTDDEMEDNWAQNWDFRFGKTAYGFMNVNLRNGGVGADTTVIDTTKYDGKGTGRKDVSVITQTRPYWMSNQYIYKYGSDVDADNFGVDFTTNGQLNIRIPGTEAKTLLKPQVQSNGSMITDTVFTVVVNDGHSGLNFVTWPVFINYQPSITTESLPSAKEDIDYNPQLLDSLKMIHVYDPNFDQDHTFELVYDNYPDDAIPADNCYPEAGSFDLANLKTTPKWLKINPMSGLLYGTPGVLDAPKQEKVTVVVWDLINGEKQLAHVKTFDLTVDSTNHRPHIMVAPLVRCVDKGKPYSDTVKVTDWDLQRDEVVTVKVVQPSTGFTCTPATVSGKKTRAQVEAGFSIVISTTSFDATPDADGKVTIKVQVTDASGMTDDIIYRLKYSDPTDFVCPITIENSKGGKQIIEFGTAPKDATTGDGLDGEPVGTLDNQFCEYELPPRPESDIFDVRWTVPNTNGTYRDIFPRAKTGVKDVRIYKGIFQSGGEAGNTSNHYPIFIRWNKNDIPDKTDAQRNPTGSQWFIRDAGSNGNVFHYNMRTGGGGPQTGEISIKEENNVFTIQINRDAINAFVIMHDWASAVNDNTDITTGISAIQPNPVENSTSIQFGLATSGNVRMEVIDELGKVVSVITDAAYEPGQYTIDWSARNLAGAPLVSGSYTLRMTSGTVTSTKGLVIVK